MEKKFASVLMGGHYTLEQHQAHFETKKRITSIFTVNDYEQARQRPTELEQEGSGAVELCGALGEEKTKELIILAHGKIAIGFTTHLPEQDELFASFFAKGRYLISE